MKLFNLLFSLYFLSLTVVPCADEAFFPERNGTSHPTLAATDTHRHAHDDENSEHCSPLCFCGCCHVNVRPTATGVPALRPPLPLLPTVPVCFIDAYRSVARPAVWQPPRLA